MLDKIKKLIPYILGIIRAISFVPLIFSTFSILDISFIKQIILSAIIVISDKFDGEISRKYNDEKGKLKFRIFDTIIDKTGIVLCLIGLLITKKMPALFFSILMTYNFVLLSAGAINLCLSKEKKEKTVQGLFISRLFTFLSGVSLLVFNNFSLNNLLSISMSLGMATMGLTSLGIQAKDKLMQRKNHIKQQNMNNSKEVFRMRKINVIKGLLKNQSYIKQLETSISQVYDQQVIETIGAMQDLEQYENDFLENITNRMPDIKDYHLTNNQSKKAYHDAMQKDSRRIRPTLVQMGNLCSKGYTNKEDLINSGISIEMIHKMSLILDDYFDQDLTRRGKPTFHTFHDQRTMIDTSKLLLALSNNIFYNSVENLTNQQALLKLYKETIIGMGNGFIEDLDRTDRKICEDDAIRINNLQSSLILKNSLLIGYMLGSESIVDEVYHNLANIGLNIGTVFQGFNDIENFLSEKSQKDNKSNLYSDLKSNRKNIILSMVPKELFYPPYKDEDVIDYIRENRLIDETVNKLVNRMDSANESISQLPNNVARDTLLFASNHITDKTLRKINNCR